VKALTCAYSSKHALQSLPEHCPPEVAVLLSTAQVSSAFLVRCMNSCWSISTGSPSGTGLPSLVSSTYSFLIQYIDTYIISDANTDNCRSLRNSSLAMSRFCGRMWESLSSGQRRDPGAPAPVLCRPQPCALCPGGFPGCHQS
jgi:hypothetical protein